MKVLVTGAAGQLGNALRSMAPDFIYTDITGDGNLRLDITDAAAVNADPATVGAFKTAENVQQRGLSAAALSCDDYKFSRLGRK